MGGIAGLSMGVDGVELIQQPTVSLEKWVQKYGEWSQAEIALESGKDTFGLPKGPPLQWRYVINPYDGKTMDMRHVAVVGYAMGEVNGLGAEIVQKVVGWLGIDDGKSAFNPQDKYSNNIGSSFFNYDWHHYGLDMSNNFGNRFSEFLKTVYKK